MLLSLLILASPAAAAADPLAPARAGQLQCINPNVAAKTCQAMGTFTVAADGSYQTVTRTVINPQPLIIMEVKGKGKAEGELTCGTLDKADYEAATFTMDGAAMAEEIAGTIRTQLLGAIAPLAGKKACIAQKPEGDLILAEVTLDGTARPDLTQKMLWVKPDAGYKVAP